MRIVAIGNCQVRPVARLLAERLSLKHIDTDHMIDCTEADRRRIFNLGYYTWVEQQGIEIPDFEARRSQDWWGGLRGLADKWDGMIEGFNDATGASFSA